MKTLITTILILFYSFCYGQDFGGGEYKFAPSICITNKDRLKTLELLKARIYEVHRNYPDFFTQRSDAKMEWPIIANTSYQDSSFFGISNFVDHDPNISTIEGDLSSLMDYQCGFRTYDVEGYNHTGTDIFLWPFMWKLMYSESINAIAAKAGIILLKLDGEKDDNCAFCTSCNWNAVYLIHDDNTISVYGHLKKGTLTDKLENQMVETGEFLGKIGSSGNSTGPHLHFEYTDINGNIIDPFVGNCNQVGSSWVKQLNYRIPKINRISTGYNILNLSDCNDGTENEYEQNEFDPGEIFYVNLFYRDELLNALTTIQILDPNNNVVLQWSHTGPQDYNASYWWWKFTIPLNALVGKYRIIATFNNEKTEKSFYVGIASSINNLTNTNLFEINNNMLTSLDHELSRLMIFDFSGRLILSERNIMDKSLNYLNCGIYIIQAIDKFGKIQNVKFNKI